MCGIDVLLVFTKYPIPGFAKTRLIPELGPQGAASVSRTLTEHCIRNVRLYASHVNTKHAANSVQSRPCHVAICYSAQNECNQDLASKIRKWLGERDLERIEPQLMHGDLGQKMEDMFKRAFHEWGASRVVVVGTDIPETGKDVLLSAFSALENKDVVVGPAEDGGYYLLGMKSFHHVLFRGIAWSTETVFASTRRIAEQQGLSMSVLETLRDIDLPGDLPYFRKICNQPQS